MFTTDLFEQNLRPVTVCFGRMNPPTLGHGQLLKTVADHAAGADYYIFATKTHKLPDNPLPYDVKFNFLQAMFPEYAEHMVYNPELKTIMQVAQWLYDQGYTELNFVAGSDRIPEFSKLLNTYNGKGQPGDKGYYIFSKINMISAGDRDPDAEGLSGISASKARAAAAAGNFDDFVAKTGAGKLSRPLYNAVRDAMGVSEDVAPDSQSTTSPIHGNNIEEEAAGVGVVAANKKMTRDPRYSMSITKDVKPSTPKNMLRALRLAETKKLQELNPLIAAGAAAAGLATGAISAYRNQNPNQKTSSERIRDERKQAIDKAIKDKISQPQEPSSKLDEKWSQKQRKSVDCSNPKGFSQKAHCAGRRARQSGRNTKSSPISESRELELSVVPMIKKFLPIVKKELELDQLPKIKIQRHVEVHNGQATFGRFVNDDEVIYVGIADRHPVDVLRTLAHELVHWKQFTEGRIKPDSGETGSDIENEAHAVAGVLMRHFNKQYPDAIKLDNIELQESQDYVAGNISYSETLNPVAWAGNELKSEVRDRLLKISGEFVKYLEVPGFKVLDVVLTGSMANYNWTKYSDFDLHVITNYSDLECEDLAETFYRAKKELWNNYHDITIGGHEVEMYVEDAAKPPVSAGIFSILDNRWIKKPQYDKPEVDKSAVNAKVADLAQQIKSAMQSADTVSDIQRIKDKLRRMRRSGLDTGGEFSVENLSYKILRNMGLLNKMSDIQTANQDRRLSLPEDKKKVKYLRPGELRGSYTDQQLRQLGFRQTEKGQWHIDQSQWDQLVANKQINETEVEEARMGASDFAAAVEQGQTKGVLVGFEFEVLVPRATIEQSSQKQVQTIDAALVQDLINRENLLIDQDTSSLTPEQFDNLFKLKPEKSANYPTATEAYNAFKQKKLENVIQAFNNIPEEIRKKYVSQIKAKINPRLNAYEKQMEFARMLGFVIYNRHFFGDTGRLGYELQNSAKKEDEWSYILRVWFGIDADKVQRRLNSLFEYNPETVYEQLRLSRYQEDDYDNYHDYDYQGAVKVLQPALKQTFGSEGRAVTVFNSYHEKRKNVTDWYIEPDGSIHPNSGEDGAAEVVSPPYPAQQAMSALRSFYTMAQGLNLYTNSSTGLHINVSIPEKIDILKLALFVGDQYVLKQFGREESDYAASAVKQITRQAYIAKRERTKKYRQPYDLKTLANIAKSATNFHSASISNNGKYISFRHAGGDYLSNLDNIAATVGRFIRAMLIAADPAAYVQEYKAELAKLTQTPIKTDLPAQLRTQGLPAYQLSVYVTSKNKSIDTVKPHQLSFEIDWKNFYIKHIESNSAAAKQSIVNTTRSPEAKQYAQNDSLDKFYTLTVLPSNEIGLRDINAFVEHGVTSEPIGYNLIRKIMLPATDPAAQALLKSVLQSQYGKKPVKRTR